MIIVRDLKHQERPDPPPWMVGAGNRHCREDIDGRLWGIGDGYLLGPRDKDSWRDIGDGYQVSLHGEAVPTALMRRQNWYDVSPVESLTGIVWMAPSILTPQCTRAFRTRIGPDFLPALSIEQVRLEAIARAARDALEQAKAGNDGVPMSVCGRWVAELMCEIYHLTPEIIAHLALLDETLIVTYLGLAAAYDLAVKRD